MFKNKKGFFILYAIIVINVLLVFVIGIVNLSIRERQLTEFGQSSVSAFFATESGMDCVLYWDLMGVGDPSSFVYTPLEPGGRDIICNGQQQTVGDVAPVGVDNVSEKTMSIDYSSADNPNNKVDISVIKEGDSGSATTIDVHGYSGSDTGRGTERGLQVVYGGGVAEHGQRCDGFDISFVLDTSGSIRDVIYSAEILKSDADPVLCDSCRWNNTGCVLPASPSYCYEATTAFEQMLIAAQSVIDAIKNPPAPQEPGDISEEGFKFAIISFSTETTLQSVFSYNETHIRNTINAIEQPEIDPPGPGHMTNMAGGLIVTDLAFKASPAGTDFTDYNRPDFKDIAVIITDGTPTACPENIPVSHVDGTYLHLLGGISFTIPPCDSKLVAKNDAIAAAELLRDGPDGVVGTEDDVTIIAVGVGSVGGTGTLDPGYLIDFIISNKVEVPPTATLYEKIAVQTNYKHAADFSDLENVLGTFNCEFLSRSVEDFSRTPI